MNTFRLLLAIPLLAGTLNRATAQQQVDIHLLNTFHIASSGGWDYLAIQPNSNKLFVSHGTQVNIIDKNNGDSIGVIPNTTGVHGIAFVPALNKGFTSNGKLNTVTVFDLKTNAVLTQVPTGEGPDAIFYEPFSKRIITCNGRSKNLSLIDPVTDKLTATISLIGRPETAVGDNAGKIYVNLEDKSMIAVVNIATNTVENNWPLAPGEAPTGLAIDTKTRRLFAGCSDNKLLVILDATTGKLIDKLPIGDHCDGVEFDPALNVIYASNGDGTLTVIHETSKDKFVVEANIPTKKGARTIAIDHTTHKIYLPTADMEPPAKQGERSKMIPGSFQVLVLGK